MKIILLALFLLLAPLPALAGTVKLTVPYTSEVPDNKWVKPWNNACEEAAVVMVEQYYLGNRKSKLTAMEAKKLMRPLFKIEDKLFNNNADTNATRTAKVINGYTAFSAAVKNNPSLEEIKAELNQSRPVISFHYGFDLHNPLIPFRRNGSYYHVLVLTGYDDKTKEFIVNDPGNHASGLDFRYQYDTILNTLRDFDHQTKKVTGPPRALFTSLKLVKATGKNNIYFLDDGKKRYVTHPAVFKTRGWKWSWVVTKEKSWLDQLPTGEMIVK